MLRYFHFDQADFLAKYHARSSVESTFSMLTAKFKDSVRSRTDNAMNNEVILKFLCRNLVVIHPSMIELRIDGTFWPKHKTEENRNILRFPVE